MKTHTSKTNNHYRWKSTLRKFLSLLSSSRQSVLQQAVMTRQKLSNRRFAPLDALVTRPVYRFHLQDLSLSKRHVVGIVMLGAGVLGVFASAFFDPMSYDHAPCKILGLTNQCFSFETRTGWCFMDWFYYLDSVGIFIGMLFWSVAGIMFVPAKYSLSPVPFSLMHAFAWVKLLHISFFARSYETYHAFPEWQIIIAALALGFGIVMSADFLLYWENHKKRGNWARFVGVTEMEGLTPEQKEPMYQQLAKEYRTIQKSI